MKSKRGLSVSAKDIPLTEDQIGILNALVDNRARMQLLLNGADAAMRNYAASIVVSNGLKVGEYQVNWDKKAVESTPRVNA